MNRSAYPFEGYSGRVYFYYWLPPNTNLPPVAGNYIFAIPESHGWEPWYVGQAENLQDRIVSSHEKLREFGHDNVVNILYHENSSGEEGRRYEERDLINGLNPLFNDN